MSHVLPPQALELARYALDLLLGIGIGFLGGLFGIGGGFVAIPVLGILYGVDEQHAQGTSLAMVVPNVISTLAHYARRSRIDPRIAAALIAGALPTTYLGAHLAVHLPSSGLRRGFAVFMLAIAIFYVWQTLRRGAAAGPPASPRPWPLAVPIGGLAGVVSGLFGVGGAIFAVPIVVFVFGLAQAAAQGLSLTLVAPGLLVALGTYAAAGDVAWLTGAVLAAGSLLTIRYGVALAHHLPERRLRLLFALLCAVSAVGLWARA